MSVRGCVPSLTPVCRRAVSRTGLMEGKRRGEGPPAHPFLGWGHLPWLWGWPPALPRGAPELPSSDLWGEVPSLARAFKPERTRTSPQQISKLWFGGSCGQPCPDLANPRGPMWTWGGWDRPRPLPLSGCRDRGLDRLAETDPRDLSLGPVGQRLWLPSPYSPRIPGSTSLLGPRDPVLCMDWSAWGYARC